MRRGQSGYALLVVLLLLALVLVALSTAVPRFLTQGQRDKEEELIFRGQQYRRAVGLFYKKYGRYPRSMDDLLRFNDRSFLRRAFADPMTPEGKWRTIRVGPGGEFIGSVNRPRLMGSSPVSPPPSPGRFTEAPGTYPLAGVASRSPAPSIRVYQGRSYYYQWEFIYDPTEDARRLSPAPPGNAPPEKPSEPGPRR